MDSKSINELREKQITGDFQMIPGNMVDDINDQFYIGMFGEYTLPEYEVDHYHAILEKKLFSERGERLSKPFVQKFSKVTYDIIMVQKRGFEGYDVCLLHDPTKASAEPKAKRGRKPKQDQPDESLTETIN